jgi:DNA polymerase-3 subunit delta'
MHFDPWEMLCSRYEKKTLSHAILLMGSKGIGKGDFAYRFARHVLCGAGSKTAQALLDAHTHPDFRHLDLTETIKIDDIRELTQFANTTPQMGSYKVILIEGAERMNIASSNALLKTLEEPPGQMLILLTTHQPDTLLPTIRSRCQMIRLPDVPTKFSPEILTQHQEIASALKEILLGQGDIVKISERWTKLDQVFLLDYLTDCVMDLIRLKNGIDVVSLLSEVESKITIEDLFTYLDRLYEARRCLFNRLNPNTQLVLETLFI